MKVREPVTRPLDVVAAELLLSASQAFLVGVMLYLAIGVWSDRGVGAGSVAVIVAALGLAIGGGWLYWLMGGVGWPLAAANVPTSLFLGFALVLSWNGDDLFRVEGVPLLFGLAASVYGLVCAVFLDSPRRLRWDQRQRPRPGTPVPRVSTATQRFVARVPRSIPRRAAPQPADHAPARGGPVEGAPGAHATPTGQADVVSGHDPDDSLEAATTEAVAGIPTEPVTQVEVETPAATPEPATSALGSKMPTERLEKMAAGDVTATTSVGPEQDETPPAIELPTSIEPKAQKSPWAWAAPPEWTRDEDDEPPPRRRSSKRS